MEKAAISLDDSDALEAVELFPAWQTDTAYAQGVRVRYAGKLYVPSSLISSYQAATNWSTILGYANNQILPIEGSMYETQYADGTPIT